MSAVFVTTWLPRPPWSVAWVVRRFLAALFGFPSAHDSSSRRRLYPSFQRQALERTNLARAIALVSAKRLSKSGLRAAPVRSRGSHDREPLGFPRVRPDNLRTSCVVYLLSKGIWERSCPVPRTYSDHDPSGRWETSQEKFGPVAGLIPGLRPLGLAPQWAGWPFDPLAAMRFRSSR